MRPGRNPSPGALLGDVLAGPMPVETFERLQDLGDRAVWVRGNADREPAESARTGGSFVPDPIFPWAARQLRPADLPVLDALPRTVSPAGALGSARRRRPAPGFAVRKPASDVEALRVFSGRGTSST